MAKLSFFSASFTSCPYSWVLVSENFRNMDPEGVSDPYGFELPRLDQPVNGSLGYGEVFCYLVYPEIGLIGRDRHNCKFGPRSTFMVKPYLDH